MRTSNIHNNASVLPSRPIQTFTLHNTPKNKSWQPDPSLWNHLVKKCSFQNSGDYENLKPNPDLVEHLFLQLFSTELFNPDTLGFQVLEVPPDLLSNKKDEDINVLYKRACGFGVNLMNELLSKLSTELLEALPGYASPNDPYAVRHGNFSKNVEIIPITGPHYDCLESQILGLVYQQDLTRQGGESFLYDFRKFIQDYYPGNNQLMGFTYADINNEERKVLEANYRLTILLPDSSIKLVFLNNMFHPHKGGILHGANQSIGTGFRRISRIDIGNIPYGIIDFKGKWNEVPYVTPELQPFIPFYLEENPRALGFFIASERHFVDRGLRPIDVKKLIGE